MAKFYLIGFFILLCFDTLAQVAFKLSADGAGPAPETTHFLVQLAWLLKIMTGYWVYVAIGSYIGAFITWMTLLKHAPIGPAYAATHTEVVTVLIVSVLFLHEHLNVIQMVGCLLIVGGIILLGINEVKEDNEQKAKIEQDKAVPLVDTVKTSQSNTFIGDTANSGTDPGSPERNPLNVP